VERNLPSSGNTLTFGDIPSRRARKRSSSTLSEEARLLGHNYIGSEHLLLGLIREEEGIGGKILRSFGVNLLGSRQLVINYLRRREPGHGQEEPYPPLTSLAGPDAPREERQA